jgi:hypothetical protein
MLVIDSEGMDVSEIKRFLELPYVEISQDIINKYNVKEFHKENI